MDSSRPSRQKPLRAVSELNNRSAFKALELVLYSLNHSMRKPVQDLLAAGQSLDNESRLNIAHIKESMDNLELLLMDTLRHKSSIAEGDLSQADEGIVERVQVDKVLRTLATTTSSGESQEFFRYCVKTLAELYACKFSFIGLIKENHKQVRTLSVWAGDGYAENFEYFLEGTPCAEVVTFNKELIPSDAAKLYPKDELLVEMEIDSYFGAPIIHNEKGVIGLVSVMDTKPMELNEWTAPILGVFASRLALELQRNQNVAELKDLNATLEERIKDRTRELETINKELSSFTYTVTHDLRAPTRSIISFMDIVFEDYGASFDSDLHNFLSRVYRSGKKIDRIITDILGLTNINKKEVVLKKLDLNAIAKDEFDAVKEQNPSRQIELHVVDEMVCWADDGLTRILFQNLIGNAWKYTGKTRNPVIEVGKMLNGEETIFYVKDNGCGFDMQYKSKLFQPFQRLHTQHEFEGNGVGLATSLKIVERHGGRMWAESEIGKGSVFYFTFGDSRPIIKKYSTENKL